MVAVGSRQFGMLDGHCDHSIRHLSLVTVTVIGSYYKKSALSNAVSHFRFRVMLLISDLMFPFLM